MITKPLFLAVLITVNFVVSATVFGAESGDPDTNNLRPSNIYIGINLGFTDGDRPYGPSDGVGVYGGILPWRSIGMEFGIVAFGGTNNPDSRSSEDIVLFKTSALFIHQQNGNRLDSGNTVFGQLGVAIWQSEISGPFSSSESSGADLYFGFGVTAPISTYSSLRFALDFYNLDSTLGDGDVSHLSLAIQANF